MSFMNPHTQLRAGLLASRLFLFFKILYASTMPELPEVETVMRSLKPCLTGKTIKNIDVNRFDLRKKIPRSFANTLNGQTVSKIFRRGKYIVCFCGQDKGFVLHLGMSGSIRIFTKAETYKHQKHDHVIFETNEDTKIIYNDPRRFGMLYLIDPPAWESDPAFNQMGPEPLDPDFNGKTLKHTLRNKKSPIKNTLLDQTIIAGLGNIYVCEALYRSRISPKRAASDLSSKETKTLSTEIKNVLEDAILSGGSSLRDHKLTDGSLAYFQHHFDVYGKEGETCKRCRNKNKPCIKRETQSGRSSFFCSNTQI